ncbi:chromosome partitioning protein ParA [Helicobacter pylori]|nr:chromosome partitioning protein ParA [Helicobacter pylori]
MRDIILSERIAYKRSVSEGMGVMEYNDNKAKNEWSQFYDELSGYLGIKK